MADVSADQTTALRRTDAVYMAGGRRFLDGATIAAGKPADCAARQTCYIAGSAGLLNAASHIMNADQTTYVAIASAAHVTLRFYLGQHSFVAPH